VTVAISLDGGTYFASKVEIQQGASSQQVRGAANTHEATTERRGRVYSRPATHYVAQSVDREVGLRTYGVDRETGEVIFRFPVATGRHLDLKA
jgi:hypothetical protein